MGDMHDDFMPVLDPAPHAVLPVAQSYFGALLTGDPEAAGSALALGLRTCGAHEALYAVVVAPGFDRLSRLRALDELEDADMDVASATARAALSMIAPRSPEGASPRAVVACAHGEGHDLGARCVANSLRSRGWATEFLGAPPAGGVLAYARLTQPGLVALSVTGSDLLPAARRLEAELRALPQPPSVLLGGAAVSVGVLT